MSFSRRCPHPFRLAGRHLLDLICPPACAACNAPVADNCDVLCLPCWDRFRQNLQTPCCPTCGHDCGPYSLIDDRCHRCRRRRPVVSRVIRVGPYLDPFRRLILGFKFHRQSRFDRFLGDLLASAVLGEPEIRRVDYFVPIPLHWRRKWVRSYNQAELLALSLKAGLKKQGLEIPVNMDLVRIRHTPPQTSLSAGQRLVNLRGAFAARPDADFRGKHICLIDDVTTTGATLRAAGQTLRKAGAAGVWAAVLAVAAND
jgi:ComF family protein